MTEHRAPDTSVWPVVPVVERKLVHAQDLRQGFRGERIAFDYRPYAERTPDEQRKYDVLAAELEDGGMRNPLITFRNHVLIGMRRFEIMVGRGTDWFDCLEIQEDVSQWWKDGPPKIRAIMQEYYT